MKSRKSSRRTSKTPPMKSPRQKYNEQYSKERQQREKCRKTLTDREMCKDCSNQFICPSEQTQDWIKEQNEGE